MIGMKKICDKYDQLAIVNDLVINEMWRFRHSYGISIIIEADLVIQDLEDLHLKNYCLEFNYKYVDDIALSTEKQINIILKNFIEYVYIKIHYRAWQG